MPKQSFISSQKLTGTTVLSYIESKCKTTPEAMKFLGEFPAYFRDMFIKPLAYAVYYASGQSSELTTGMVGAVSAEVIKQMGTILHEMVVKCKDEAGDNPVNQNVAFYVSALIPKLQDEAKRLLETTAKKEGGVTIPYINREKLGEYLAAWIDEKTPVAPAPGQEPESGNVAVNDVTEEEETPEGIEDYNT